MNEEALLSKFYKLYDEDEYSQAREILFKLLKNEPDSHWILSRISSTYYEDRNYKKALVFAERALEIAPDCPMVLWDYSGVLDMLDDTKKAISIWKYLLSCSVEQIAFDECGEGIRDAKSLHNDCRFRIGTSYKDLNQKKLAIKYLKLHLQNRQRGLPSIYSKKEVLKLLDSMS